MELKLSKYTSIFFIICINCQTAVGSGWCDYSTRLPNGYELNRTNAPSIFIFHPTPVVGADSCVVPPKIVALNVYGSTIVGKTEHSPDADDWGPAAPGYFILDTKNHKVQLGLDKDTWLNTLKSIGITEVPSLKKPSPFFMIKIQLPRALKWMMVGIGIVLAMLLWHKFHKPHKLRNQVSEK